MNATTEERVADLERRMAELTAKVLNLTPPAKDWRHAVGTLVDDEVSREADRLGAEWRKQANDM
jgi:hypothetical protein